MTNATADEIVKKRDFIKGTIAILRNGIAESEKELSELQNGCPHYNRGHSDVILGGWNFCKDCGKEYI